MKLTKRQIDKYLIFLNEYKVYVGLHDWKIMLDIELLKGDSLAHTQPDNMEKEMIVTLSEEFLDKSETVQCNILFHELMHGKVCIHNNMIRAHVAILEEHFVNDITRGFEKALEKEWVSLKEEKN